MMKCEVAGGAIHYEVRGEGRPIIVLHAMGTDHRAMSAWMEPACAHVPGWQRIYVDLPVHGRSVRGAEGHGTEHFTDLLLDFIAAVLPHRRFSIVGMSYGAFLAQGIIQRLHRTIDGICLVAPPVQLDSGQRDLPPRIVCEKDEALLACLDPDIRSAFETLFVYQNRNHYDAFLAEIQPGRQLADREFLSSNWRETGYSYRAAPLSGLDALHQTTLIVLGKQDAICGYNDQINVLGSLFSRATFAVLDGAGHMIPIERRTLLQHMLTDWLYRMVT